MPDPSPLLLLVVENDEILGSLIREVIENAGHRGRAVRTVAAADSALRDQPFDAVLLDLKLDDESGEDLVRRLREAGRPIPPVIILSGQPEETLEEAAARIGAVAIIEKPCTVAELLRAISIALPDRATPTHHQQELRK